MFPARQSNRRCGATLATPCVEDTESVILDARPSIVYG